MLLQNNYAEPRKSAAPGQARAPRHFVPLRNLTDPDPVEKSGPKHPTSRGTFLPLLGERVGVRAGLSAYCNSMSGSIQRVESGVLRLRAIAPDGRWLPEGESLRQLIPTRRNPDRRL